MHYKQKIDAGEENKNKKQKEACLISNSKILESSVNTWKTVVYFIKETTEFSFTFPLLHKVKWTIPWSVIP